MKPIVIHRQDKNNVGDLYCNPLMYYNIEHDVIDIEHLNVTQYNSDRPIIAGGGGLIENDWFGDILKNLLVSCDFNTLQEASKTIWEITQNNNAELRNEFQKKISALIKEYIDKINIKKTAPRIVWGAGHNKNLTKLPKVLEWPSYLSGFDLVGLRDVSNPYEYVPCASCKHSAFDKKYEIKNDIIFFEHKKQLIKSTDFGKVSIPRFINTGDNMEQTIELLGSSNVILTNSYHGAYWGCLLGKKVIIVEPWSSKFFLLDPAPAIIPKINLLENLDEVIENAKIPSNYLEQCRNLNDKYFSQVKELL